MATLIGVVSQVIGEVYAVAGDGTRRPLSEGDRVFAGEQIVTGASGSIAVAMSNGQQLTLGRDSSLNLNEQMLAGSSEQQTPTAETPPAAPSDGELTDVEKLQAAIEAGVDPTLEGEATAAGPGAGGGGGGAGGAGGGHSFVLLGETGGALDPVIGFPTEGFNTGPEFPNPEPEVADPIVDEPDFSPVIDIEYRDAEGSLVAGPGVVDEEALIDGSNPGSTAEQTSGTIIINSPDGISSLQVQGFNGIWVDVTAGGVVQGQYGTLAVDAAGNWIYTLTSNTLNHGNPNATGAADQVGESFPVRMFDLDGDVSPTVQLNVLVNDDGPTAALELVSEAAPVVHDETAGVQDDTDSAGPLPAAFAGVIGTLMGWSQSAGAVVSTAGSSYGADDEGAFSTVISLSITGGDGTDSGLETTDGQSIFLFKEGGLIVGRVGASDGPAAFAVSIDAGTGVLNVAQYLSLHHPDSPNEHDEAVSLLFGGGEQEEPINLINAVVTVTDGDGDVAVSDTVGIGQLIQFDDDGPTQSVTALSSEGVRLQLLMQVDETQGTDRELPPESADGNTDDGVGYLGRVTTSVPNGGLVSLFNAAGDYGSDGAGSVNGAFSFVGIPLGGSLATNLSATVGGAIVLKMEGNNVVGVDGGGAGDVVFRIEIVGAPGNPQLQTTLYEAIHHTGTNATFDEQLNLLLSENGSLSLQYEVTRIDGDGDTIKDAAQITLANANGSVFGFDDDGPTQSVTALSSEGVRLQLLMQVDETQGTDRELPPESADGNTDDGVGYLGRVTTSVPNGGLVSLFNAAGDYGSDGAGSVNGAFSFVGIPLGGSLATNLSATVGGAIVLKMEGNNVVGVDGGGAGDVVFRIEIVGAPGNPQLQTTLYEAIHHTGTNATFDEQLNLLLSENGSLSLQYEVTRIDGDGDTIKDAAQITLANANGSVFGFDDDGPTQSVTALSSEGVRLQLLMQVDETQGTDRELPPESADGNTDDGVGYLGRVTTSVPNGGLVSLFNAAGDYGSDGAGSVNGAFSFVGIPLGGSLATNLSATVGGAIVLKMEGNNVVGVDGGGAGDVVFRIEIVGAPGNPQLQTTLYEAIHHTGTNATFDEQLNLLLSENGSLSLQYEVTRIDGDGDTIKDAAQITLANANGSVFGFDDDGPTQSVTALSSEGVRLQLLMQVDETQGTDRELPPESADGNTDDGVGYLGRVTTSVPNGGLVSLFNAAGDYGSDGAGSVNGAFSFVGIPLGGSLATNLSATVGGAIVLKMEGNNVVGVDGGGAGDVVFRIEIVGAPGNPQLQTTLYEAIHHTGTNATFDEQLNLLLSENGSLSLQYEVTRIDGDGDTIKDAAQITLANANGSVFGFDDDGPTQSVTALSSEGVRLQLLMQVDETQGTDRELPPESADGNTDDGVGYLGRVTTSVPNGGLVSLFNAAGDYGSDGAGSVNGAFSFVGIPLGGSLATNLSATVGGAIVLKMEGNNVVGVDGGGAGDVVFRIEIVGAPGNPQLQTTLYEAIHHTGTNATFDEQLNLLLSENGSLSLQYEVTRIDGDGDTIKDAAQITLANANGSVFGFDDDGPTQSVTALSSEGVRLQLLMQVDETQGTDRELPPESADGNTDDGVGYLGRVTTSVPNGGLVSLFNAAGDYGSDGAGSVNGAFSFVGIPLGGSLATNLSATVGGAIVLKMEGNNVVGVDGGGAGDVVFRIEIVGAPGNPQLQTTLYEAIHHTGTNATFDEQLNLLLSENGSLSLQYEVTRIDGDGDTIKDAAQITLANANGSVFGFDDDGPTQSVTALSSEGVRLQLLMQVDETQGTDRELPPESADGNTDDGVGYLGRVTTSVPNGGLVSLFNAAGDYGSDGAGSVNGAFSFVGIPLGGSLATNLSATVGGAIVLKMEGNNVVGVDGGGAGDVVFRIEIVGAPGNPQLQTTLYEAIHHTGTNATFDEQLNLLLSENGSLSLQYEVTRIDGDGDTIKDAAQITLANANGSVFGFDDDGPTQSVTALSSEGVRLQLLMQVDETQGTDRELPPESADGNTDDGVGYLGRVTTSVPNGGLVSLFNAAGDYGSDGAGSVNGAFSFVGIPLGGSLATNLSATVGGAIVLKMEGNNVVGVDGGGAGDVVFRIEIVGAPGNPQLQTTLYEAIHHTGTNATFDEQLNLLLSENGSLSLQYEVTRIDGDGDTIKDAAQITLANANGSVFGFDDDGPTQSVTALSSEGVRLQLLMQVDETQGTDRELPPESADGNTDDGVGYLGRVTTSVPNGGLVSLFNAAGDYGSDGAGSVNGAFSFVGIPLGGSLATNLSATVGGAIVLKMEGNNVVGVDGGGAGDVVFRIEIVGAPGNPQLQTTLYEAIHHTGTNATFDEQLNLLLSENGSLSLQYEVTRIDGDGDTIKDAAQITLANANGSVFGFDDDGPDITNEMATLILDDEGQSTAVNPGPDAAGIVGGPGDDAGVLYELQGDFDFAAGSDGLKTFEITGLSANGSPLQAINVNTTTGKGTVEAVNVTWAQNGADAGGTYTGVGAVSGHTIFTLVMTASGHYTFTLLEPLAHPATHDGDAQNGVETEWEDNLSLVFGVKITDQDNDSDTATLTINVDDDTLDVAPAALADLTGINQTVSAALGLAPGADGWQGVTFDLAAQPQGLKSGGQVIQYEVQGNVLVGYTDNINDPVFKVTVDLAVNSYSVQLLKPLDGVEGQLVPIGGATAFGAGPTGSQVLTSGSGGTGQQLAIVTGWNASGIDTAAWQSSTSPLTFSQLEVNGSTSGWGVGGNTFNGTEFMRFDFGDQDFTSQPGVSMPEVSYVNFALTNFGGGEHTVKYVVHYSDGSANAFGDINFSGGVTTWSFTAPLGKTIDYVELYANGEGGGGKVDLNEVRVLTDGTDLNLVFKANIADGDGDVEQASLSVTVTTPSAPSFDGVAVVVDEDGLSGGANPHLTEAQAGGDLVGGSGISEAVSSGTVAVNWNGDPGDLTLHITQAQLDNITLHSGGSPLLANVTGNGTQSLVIKDNSGSPVLEVTINNAGQYQVTLKQSIEHINGQNENATDPVLPVTVKATNDAGSTGKLFSITIDDDMPLTPANVNHTIVEASLRTNLLITLDMSGSMDTAVTGYASRLAAAKDALQQLIAKYDSLGDVAVRLVTFSDNATIRGEAWMTADEALNLISGFANDAGDGATNYDAAIAAAQTAFATTTGKLTTGTGIQNVSYFLSDGQPTVSNLSGSTGSGGTYDPANGDGIDSIEEGLWKDFLNTYDIKSYALGIGSGLSAGDQVLLNPIAYDGTGTGSGQEMDANMVSNIANLPAVLVSTVTQSVQGDLVGQYGADGPAALKIVAIEFDDDGSPGTPNLVYTSASAVGNVLTINVPGAGGTLVVNLATGHYDYTAPAIITADKTLSFKYVIEDSDGDRAAGNLTINLDDVTPVNDAPTATITNDSYNATEDVSLVLKGTGLSVADSDAGSGVISVTLSVGQGRLVGTAGGSGVTVGGTNTSALTLSGTLAQINAFLGAGGTSTLVYNAINAPAATTMLALLINDNGNTGGGSLTAIDTAVINITPASDPTDANGDDVRTNVGNVSVAIPEWALTWDDTDADGRLDVSAIVAGSISGGTATHTTGTSFYGSVNFNDNNGNTGGGNSNSSFSYTATDGSSSDSATVSILLDTSGALDGNNSSNILVDGIAAANSTLNGSDGNDILIGNDGNDTLNGGDDNDLLVGGSGNDALNGNADNDTAGYFDAGSGVTVSLALAAQQDTIGAGLDTLNSIENLIGSRFGDTLTGSSGNNSLIGLEGDDILIGNGGADSLTGSAGEDTFKWLSGNSGVTTITDFVQGVDSLDLSQLLTGEDDTASSLSQYLTFTFSTDTTITVDSNGAAGGGSGQSIVLQGINLQAAYGAADAAGVITSMLGDDSLKVDTV
ncbi:retention module-containing protein [Pseudomonas sp. LjRoot71]|uniref:retention module-containing protein n=1 Tax=Pseudomonas sp. LjRoot71 TaxID=3342336 RepID=UPI003ECD8B3B